MNVEVEKDLTKEEIEARLFQFACELCIHAEKDIRKSIKCVQCLTSKTPFPHFKRRKQ
jgi:hypothetical protein